MTRTWRDFNFFVIGCLLVLTGFSLAMIYSISLNNQLASGFFLRHLINLIVGSVALVVMVFVDYRTLQVWAKVLYVIGIAALAFVTLVSGEVRGGARSWLDLGVRTLQPSEPAKLLIIIALAAYWERFEESSTSLKVQLGGLLLVGVPLLLVFLQPDFGTSMVFLTVWLAMAWVAGMRWWMLLLLMLIAIPVAYFGWTHVLEDYQRERLMVFIDPEGIDPEFKKGAWDIMQSLSAVGAGGLTGRGWTQGIVTQGGYLAAVYSDYIFAAVSEELGFIGSAVLLMFEALLMWQALHVANTARDTFGKMIAVGVTAMLFCHVLVNVGMNMSIMPITGIPLPLVSYGGSFTLTTMAAIGLLESIALRRHRVMFG